MVEGEGLYKARIPGEKETRWLSKGEKQRIHTVTEINGDMYVKLSKDCRFLDSDYYQGEKGKIEREKAAKADKEIPDQGYADVY